MITVAHLRPGNRFYLAHEGPTKKATLRSIDELCTSAAMYLHVTTTAGSWCVHRETEVELCLPDPNRNLDPAPARNPNPVPVRNRNHRNRTGRNRTKVPA